MKAKTEVIIERMMTAVKLALTHWSLLLNTLFSLFSMAHECYVGVGSRRDKAVRIGKQLTPITTPPQQPRASDYVQKHG
jgi:hypothetical protein